LEENMKLLVLALLAVVGSGSLAEAREYDSGRFEAIQRRIERKQCEKSPVYCENKKLLAEAKAELAVSEDLIRTLKRETSRICEGTAIRQAERSEADGLGMRHTVRTACSDISEYVQLSAPVVAQIAEQTTVNASLQARVDELTQTVRSQTPVLTSKEYMEAASY
jgi:hypothetical protein